MIENKTENTMIDVTNEETAEIEGGFNWCAAFFIGGGGAFAAGLTGGAGTLAGMSIGAMASELFC